MAAIQRKADKRTTVQDENAQVFADKLGRDFAPASHRPGAALVGDITYLRTGQGSFYLATRKVTGWQTAEHMRQRGCRRPINGPHAAPSRTRSRIPFRPQVAVLPR